MSYGSIRERIEVPTHEFLQAIAQLIRINSVRGPAGPGEPYGPGPAAALKAALEIAESMGFRTANLDGYVGTVDYGPEERQLDILAHLDVVPAGEGWTVTDPFAPRILDGRLYGRGAADDKGPAMAALFAMKAVRDLGIPLQRGVRLILGTDEENGSSDIRYYYAREPEAPMTFSPDANYPVISIEKGGYQPRISAHWAPDSGLPRVAALHAGVKGNVIPGTAWTLLEGFDPKAIQALAEECAHATGAAFTVTEQDGGLVRVEVAGISAHASLPEDGVNALTAILEMAARLPAADSEGFRRLCALHALFPHGDWRGEAAGIAMSDPESGELTVCLDMLDYADGELSGAIDSRLPVCATEQTVYDVLRGKLAAVGLEPDGSKQFPAHCVPADSALVQGLMKCYEEYTGRHEKPLAIGGGTYVHGLKNGVAFGCSMPGTDNRMHGADEFAVIEELELSVKIFAQAIVDFCS